MTDYNFVTNQHPRNYCGKTRVQNKRALAISTIVISHSSNPQLTSKTMTKPDRHRAQTQDPGSPQIMHSSSRRFWVIPEELPDSTSIISETAGNVSDYIKRLNVNTFAAYGVGSDDCFAHEVGRKVKFTNVDVDKKGKREGRVESTTIAEVVVDKCE